MEPLLYTVLGSEVWGASPGPGVLLPFPVLPSAKPQHLLVQCLSITEGPALVLSPTCLLLDSMWQPPGPESKGHSTPTPCSTLLTFPIHLRVDWLAVSMHLSPTGVS